MNTEFGVCVLISVEERVNLINLNRGVRRETCIIDGIETEITGIRVEVEKE